MITKYMILYHCRVLAPPGGRSNISLFGAGPEEPVAKVSHIYRYKLSHCLWALLTVTNLDIGMEYYNHAITMS